MTVNLGYLEKIKLETKSTSSFVSNMNFEQPLEVSVSKVASLYYIEYNINHVLTIIWCKKLTVLDKNENEILVLGDLE